MLNIVNIDYEKVLEQLKAENYKCAVFFFYSKYEDFYNSYLSQMFDEINGNSGKKIAFITHYSILEYDKTEPKTLRNYRDKKWSEKSVKEENEMAYKTMYNVAKSFNRGIENCFPCFVILDPNNTNEIVVESAKKVDDIFVETQNIIVALQKARYKIKDYNRSDIKSRYYLSASEVFEENIKACKYGINVNNLKKVIEEEKANESFDFNEIDRLQKRGYISFKTFFRNIDKIRIGRIPEGPLSGIIENALLFYNNDSKMLFPSIKSFIEGSSKDYLCVANKFASRKDEMDGIDRSMTVICLGKVVEDELNLGVFNTFRGRFGVSLPAYFDQYQDGLEINKNFYYIEDSQRKSLRIHFNKKKEGTNELIYPKTSETRKISFDIHCNTTREEDIRLVNNIRNEIEMFKPNIPSEILKIYLDNVEIIAETRNHAIHYATPIDSEEYDKAYTAFKCLVDNDFFEMNNKFKSIIEE